MKARPLIVTGQQIGAGWSPALSVAKALAALSEARRCGGEAVFWMADEDHDRAEVAAVVGWREGRLLRHRFGFSAPLGTATGWLPWTAEHQAQAEALWGPLPSAATPWLKAHVRALGQPLWDRGLRPFSPTDPALRDPIQGELERWRKLNLEALLVRQWDTLVAQGIPAPLDPRVQAAWFSLDPRTGRRQRLEVKAPLPPGHWLSPGAALRPLMQSLLLPVTAAVLGPSERAYWRLCEPLWDQVGLTAPSIIARPSVFVLPRGSRLSTEQLEPLRRGQWHLLGAWQGPWPTGLAPAAEPDSHWPASVQKRFTQELGRTRERLARLDRRLQREAAASQLGGDPEDLRQGLFPFNLPQERVLPGASWLANPALLDQLLARMDGHTALILLEEP